MERLMGGETFCKTDSYERTRLSRPAGHVGELRSSTASMLVLQRSTLRCERSSPALRRPSGPRHEHVAGIQRGRLGVPLHAPVELAPDGVLPHPLFTSCEALPRAEIGEHVCSLVAFGVVVRLDPPEVHLDAESSFDEHCLVEACFHLAGFGVVACCCSFEGVQTILAVRLDNQLRGSYAGHNCLSHAQCVSDCFHLSLDSIAKVRTDVFS